MVLLVVAAIVAPADAVVGRKVVSPVASFHRGTSLVFVGLAFARRVLISGGSLDAVPVCSGRVASLKSVKVPITVRVC